MDKEKFQKLISDTPSSWLGDAKHRQRWKWLRTPIFKIRVIYLRLKRKCCEGL